MQGGVHKGLWEGHSSPVLPRAPWPAVLALGARDTAHRAVSAPKSPAFWGQEKDTRSCCRSV